MKKVGIIGGAGPLASSLLYQEIIHGCYQKALSMPEIILLNFPFTRGLSHQEGHHNSDVIKNELRYCVETLVKNGVEIAVLACNTLHLFLEQLSTPIRFLALPSLVIEQAIQQKSKRLLLLATENSCRSKLYRHASLDMLTPPENVQKVLDEVIDRILEGKILNSDAELISSIIRQMTASMSFDGVILGCSDLPVLHHHFPIQADCAIYDSIKIPANIILKTAVGDDKLTQSFKP